jgi:Arc/MetJ-type ribon-helix-helix transcriptional regulator
MAVRTAIQKVTFSLPADLAREMREVVSAGLFPSQNALVRSAIMKELKRVRTEQLRREFHEAAQDPMFLRDIQETEQAFQSADSETARMIPDDRTSVSVVSRQRATRPRARVRASR